MGKTVLRLALNIIIDPKIRNLVFSEWYYSAPYRIDDLFSEYAVQALSWNSAEWVTLNGGTYICHVRDTNELSKEPIDKTIKALILTQ